MQRRWEIGIGLCGMVFAIAALMVWFPNDIKGDFMELTRSGKPEPGDAFFPTLLAGFIAFFSFIQIAIGAFRSPANESDYKRITLDNLFFLFVLTMIILSGFGLMYWTGPLMVNLFDSAESYRLLIDTAPYKYIGFVTGGFFMIFSLITWTEGHIRFRTVLSGVILLFLLILIFDVALTNIQLPPNADY